MTDAPDGPVLALVGPTATGKSGLALAVARARRRAALAPVEVVAVDAFTLYRGMDVGTAKPTRSERAEVAHHGLDLLDPWEDISVKTFQTVARRAIADIAGRGHVPLLVGGSGLYFRAVVDDLGFPPRDASVRARLEEAYRHDPPAAHARLAREDPEAADKIEPGNLRRSVRALEVIEVTGERFSSFGTAWEAYRSIYPGLRVAYLEPPGTQLRASIDRRSRQLVADGLVEEARALRALPRPLSVTAAQAIGYAEAFAVLDGNLHPDELAPRIARRTWRYARGQRSWFRRDPRCAPTTAPAVLAAWARPDPA